MRLLLLLSSLLLLTTAYRITEELNEQLQERCGRRAYQRKVINGEDVSLGQFPWTATMYIKRDNGRLFLGPATIISNRHMIAFNIIRQNSTGLYLAADSLVTGTTCEGDHMILPDDLLPKFDVDFEYLTPLRPHREFHNTIGRIVIVNGCKGVGSANLFIIELKEDLKFNKNRRPACVSNSPKNWMSVDEFPMYGINSTGILGSANFKPIECDVKAPLACAKAVDSNQGLCAGDFGGTATPYINNKAVILGMFAKGNINCRADPATIENYKFINLGFLRSEICNITGVCVPAPPDDVTEEPRVTTTLSPDEVTEEPRVTTTLSPDEVTEEPRVTTTLSPDDVTETNASTLFPDEQRVTTTLSPEEVTETDPSTPFTDVYHPSSTTYSPDDNSTDTIFASTYPPMELQPNSTDTIFAETFPPMPLNPEEQVQEVEKIVAETFERLQLNGTEVEAKILAELVVAKLAGLEGCLGGAGENQVENKKKKNKKQVHLHIHFEK